MATYTLYAVIEEHMLDGDSEVVRAFASLADAQYYERLSTANNADRDGPYSYYTSVLLLEADDDGLPFVKF